MSHERFFLERPPDGRTLRLEREEAHHLRHVRRVKVGDEIELFDGSGTDYVGRVKAFDKAGATVEIIESRPTKREPVVAVTVAASVVKEQGMDRLIDSCTQLGMRRLIPMVTARSVVRPGPRKYERWRRIAVEACKQCGRSIVPEIDAARTFAGVLDTAKDYDVAVIATVGPGARALSAAALGPSCRSVLCLVGPEGGFTEQEEKAAIAAGCVAVSLSRSILRTETAAAAALALALGADNR